jgi:hypothetical protein
MRLGKEGVRDIYANIPECNGDDKVVGQSLAGVTSRSVDTVVLDRKGEDTEVDLIHHFVGVIVEVAGTGSVFMSSTDMVSPRRAALPNRRKSKHEKRKTNENITKILWLRGSLMNLDRLPRKLGMCCFMHDILHTTLPGSPSR